MLGRSVGNYRLISKIGQGGMGIVYLAQHKTLGRQAAVKVLVPELSSNQDLVSRFFNEARAATAIRNPSIVEVFDFGFLDDRSAYIVMEYLDGESLAARIRKARPKVQATLVILRAIARALQAAHELGIVHRDLKPDNVFLVPDADLPSGERIKLLDFGIAKLNTIMGQTGHTRTGTVMGTPTYMAPEQCRGAGSVDHRADLYALGCIAYEMLCGQPPFVAEGTGEIIARHLYFEPAPPRSLRASLRPEVEELVLRLLQKEPVARPSTATEVVHVIDRLVATAPTVAPRVEPAEPAAALRRRRSEPLGMPAIADSPQHDVGDLIIVAGRTHDEPADPPIVLRRRRDEPLAPTIPAGRQRNEPADPASGRDLRKEEVLAPTVPSGRRASAPRVPAQRRPQSEPLEPVAAAGRQRNAPIDPPAAADRVRDEPLAPPDVADRRRSGGAHLAITPRRSGESLRAPVDPNPQNAASDPAVDAGHRRAESVDPVPAAYRRLSDSLDRPVTSPRSATMDTTLSGAVVSDVNTSVPTVMRPRFVRSRLGVSMGAAVVVALVLVTWMRLAPRGRRSTAAASVELTISPVSPPAADPGEAPSASGSAERANSQLAPTPTPPTPMPSQPPATPQEPALAPREPTTLGEPATPVAPPASASSPATKDAVAGHDLDSLDGLARPSAKQAEGTTSGEAGRVADRIPAGTGHKQTRGKSAALAKPAIPDRSSSGSAKDPVESTPPEDLAAAPSVAPATPMPVKLTSPLQLSCEVAEKAAAPGQKLHISCYATNTNKATIRITAVTVTVGAGAAQAADKSQLPDVEPHGSVKLDITPTLFRSVEAGELPIAITVNASDSEPAQRQIVVRIVPPDEGK